MKNKTILLKTQETLLIREAEESDAADLIAYMKIVADETPFLSFPAAEFTKTVEEEAEILREHHERDNHIFMIGFIGGEIVSVLNVWASHKSRLRHIGEFGITVKEAHWGKGIGKAMLTHAIDWVKRSGVIRKFNLHVIVTNRKAVRLYEQLGFEHEGEIRRSMCVDGEFYDCFTMGMLID
ncbi:MAG: GNAT family protein [Bacteroidota bacterium]